MMFLAKGGLGLPSLFSSEPYIRDKSRSGRDDRKAKAERRPAPRWFSREPIPSPSLPPLEETGDEAYELDDSELTNDEPIGRLGDEYQRALLDGDQERIDNDISPRFWGRFATYFNQYRLEWKNPNPQGEVDEYMLDEHNLGKVQTDWMDQVLTQLHGPKIKHQYN
jgi:hypothetical protein